MAAAKEKGREKEEDQDQDDLAMPRNNILVKKLLGPKRVQLPNDRVFYARCKKVGRNVFNPTRVRIARTYVRKIGPRKQKIRRLEPEKQRRRRQQASRGFEIATAFDLGKKSVGSSIGKMLINDAIDYIPTAYKNIKKKTKKKTGKAVPDTGNDD